MVGDKKLLEMIEAQRWKNAKTYEKVAPHEYIVDKWNPILFKHLCEAIDERGVDEEFEIYGHRKTYRYLYLGGYKYWHFDIILNRARVDNE